MLQRFARSAVIPLVSLALLAPACGDDPGGGETDQETLDAPAETVDDVPAELADTPADTPPDVPPDVPSDVADPVDDLPEAPDAPDDPIEGRPDLRPDLEPGDGHDDTPVDAPPDTEPELPPDSVDGCPGTLVHEDVTLDAQSGLGPLVGVACVAGSVTVLADFAGFDLGLPELVRVDGDLVVEGTGVSAILLPHLETLGGDLVVKDNPSLESVDAPKLDEIPGELVLKDNDALASLQGLSSLTWVGSALISGLPLLESLAGLDALTGVGGSLALNNNAKLADLTALSKLSVVDGTLTLSMNGALQSLAGLDALELTGGLVLWVMNGLTTLDGLGALATIEGDLSILATGLESLEALQLETLTGDLVIKKNAALPACEADALVDALVEAGYEGAIDVSNNGPACE